MRKDPIIIELSPDKLKSDVIRFIDGETKLFITHDLKIEEGIYIYLALEHGNGNTTGIDIHTQKYECDIIEYKWCYLEAKIRDKTTIIDKITIRVIPT